MVNLSSADLTDAARMMRAMLEELPPASPSDRALARRMEGAAVALDELARVPETID